KDDIVLDPFCGSGTTCLSSIKNHRHYIGYDVNSEYIQLSEKRINNYLGENSLFECVR
ncbi:MAG: DNA adenine methylase, partial [Leptospiraceae bacterium]|nr:DNA adenine methylase [Leptospiraceae bacterium]